MDQLHWPMILYHASTETYQKDISHKFHIIYFINAGNQIITFPNYQGIMDNSKNDNYSVTYL